MPIVWDILPIVTIYIMHYVNFGLRRVEAQRNTDPQNTTTD